MTAPPFVMPGRTEFQEARTRVAAHAYHTPLFTSGSLSRQTGFEVRLKAELLQRTGSYKIRGPLNKFALLSDEQKRRGVICSSAGNHAQGVALAARIHGIKAVVVMASNATPSKVAATRGYGAEVIQHGTIWDEANELARQLVVERGYTYIHPFDDLQLIAGQGTVGLEIMDDWPDVDVIVVPIGGGGLISGIALAAKSINPRVRIVGVESSGAPGMQRSVDAGHAVTLERVDCIIDGLRVKKVGDHNVAIALQTVDQIVTLPDAEIFDAMLWVMHHAKLVIEGAAAAPVGAMLKGLVAAPPGARVVCVLSGGNVDLEQLRGLRWN
ncbi:MAG TPA: threonine/serine dehydratase [Gemmatimonadales bacterium]|nr:threonine/serine dehydratase [Gemmatimonadales bacterium]